MTITTCDILQSIRADFGELWRCNIRGNSVEITTPYLLPDSSLLTVFITQRGEKTIVSDGGNLSDLLADYCALPEDDIFESVKAACARFGIKMVIAHGINQYFKSTSDPSLVSSLVFDLASFVSQASSELVVNVDDYSTTTSERFPDKADAYLRQIAPEGVTVLPRKEITEVQGVRFSAVLTKSSTLWVVSYISGSTLNRFRLSISDTYMNFNHVWDSRLAPMVAKTIPLINNDAPGYQPGKLGWQIDNLRQVSKGALVTWDERERLKTLLET